MDTEIIETNTDQRLSRNANLDELCSVRWNIQIGGIRVQAVVPHLHFGHLPVKQEIAKRPPSPGGLMVNRFTAGACCVLLPRLKRTASLHRHNSKTHMFAYASGRHLGGLPHLIQFSSSFFYIFVQFQFFSVVCFVF